MKRSSCKAFILSGFLVLIVCLAALNTKATTAVMLSDRELITGARVILTGRVGEVFSAWDEEHTMIWTYVEIRGDRLLKGNLDGSRVVLKQRGGIAGDTAVKVFGEPEFSPGQRVLLYLDSAPDGSTRVAQAFMGMFSITTDRETGRDIVSRSLDGVDVRVLPRADRQAITNTDALGKYISRIETVLRREGSRIAEVDTARGGEPLLEVPADYDRARSRSAGYSPAYVFTAGGIRWMQADSGQPITYHINPANCPVAGGAQAEASRAMAAWPRQSGANIQLQTGSQTTGCGFAFDGQNEISFGDCRSDLPPPTGTCAGIVAMTSVEYSSQSQVVSGVSFHALIEAHTVFARGMDCVLGNSVNLAEIMCHELGHSIGLAHSTDPNALMWYMAHQNGRDATLGDDDKAGVLVIYPSSGGGGGSSRPVITRARMKSNGKLIVVGDNFTADSHILLNGQALPQASVNFDAVTGRLVFKGSLSLGPVGTNVMYVINSAGSSSPFGF
jgi:hypothetical protein